MLINALFGPPEAGALWEAKLDNIMVSKGWSLSKNAAGVHIHSETKPSMIVCVDDMLMLAALQDVSKLWRNDPEDPLARYVGAITRFAISIRKIRRHPDRCSRTWTSTRLMQCFVFNRNTVIS